MLAPAEPSFLPTPWQLLVRALPHAIESALVPAVLFLVVSAVGGTSTAIAAALAWAIFCVARRFVSGRRLPGMTIVSLATQLGRSLVALAAGGSVFLYFLQPTIGGLCLAGAFLASVAVDRPLLRSFANDFCVLPRDVSEHPRVHRFFQRASLMWGALALTNAVVGLWLLTAQSTAVYLGLKTVLSIGWNAAAIAISVVWFRRTLGTHGVLGDVARPTC